MPSAVQKTISQYRLARCGGRAFEKTETTESEEISEDELKIVKIDVDENPETAQKFGIMSIPTLLFKKDGEVVKQVAGVHTKEQIKAIVSELS